jgi:hypothetical protein
MKRSSNGILKVPFQHLPRRPHENPSHDSQWSGQFSKWASLKHKSREIPYYANPSSYFHYYNYMFWVKQTYIIGYSCDEIHHFEMKMPYMICDFITSNTAKLEILTFLCVSTQTFLIFRLMYAGLWDFIHTSSSDVPPFHCHVSVPTSQYGVHKPTVQ